MPTNQLYHRDTSRTQRRDPQILIWLKLALTLLLVVRSVPAQSTFVNLDFESAVVVPEHFGPLPFASAFPGWTGYLGANPVSEAGHNLTPLNSPWITLYGPPSFGILQGQYMAQLQARNVGDPAASFAALSQFGTVATETKSFWITARGPVNTLQIRFAGAPVALLPVPTPENPWRYAGDISSFAGVSGELRITLGPGEFGPGLSRVSLDEIVFSSQAVPEPQAVLLLLSGIGWLAISFRTRNSFQTRRS